MMREIMESILFDEDLKFFKRYNMFIFVWVKYLGEWVINVDEHTAIHD